MIKSLRHLIFKFVYGNISKVDSPAKIKDITIKNIYFNKNISYKFFRIPSCRLYTDTINNTAFIRNNSLLKEVSSAFVILSYPNRLLSSKKSNALDSSIYSVKKFTHN